MGLKEDGDLVSALTFRLHRPQSFIELVAFATHKRHYRQGKGRILAAALKQFAQHQVGAAPRAPSPISGGAAGMAMILTSSSVLWLRPCTGTTLHRA